MAGGAVVVGRGPLSHDQRRGVGLAVSQLAQLLRAPDQKVLLKLARLLRELRR